jgi:hypothetical protein
MWALHGVILVPPQRHIPPLKPYDTSEASSRAVLNKHHMGMHFVTLGLDFAIPLLKMESSS